MSRSLPLSAGSSGLVVAEAETPALNQTLPQISERVHKLSALDAAAKVLSETGQAMSCRELIAAMAAKGYKSA